MMAVMDDIRAVLMDRLDDFDVCGFISRRGHIFPLGTDTKVLSTVFELVSRPMIVACADAHGYDVVEPTAQNHYPDFTLLPRSGSRRISRSTSRRPTAARSRASSFTRWVGIRVSFVSRRPTRTLSIPSHTIKNIGYLALSIRVSPIERRRWQGHINRTS